MRCVVDVIGHLRDCEITEEHPAGQGFGAATLKAARYFRVKPATRDGHPVEATITIPMRWKMDGDSRSGAETPPVSSTGASPPPPSQPPQ